ncbi:PepSY domain-containing protein [uncultured Paracoccus sp.]|uniref:PepSY domain-containing protein n=1 Tax=uncultured Paracoccus sp. TaxID=189685 RepID=UPI0026297F38|nr:PepSY domain-containing protein [uncultured Paracoccus sp.]
MKRKLVTLLTAGAVSAAALAGGTAFASSKGNDQAEVQAFLGASQDITAAINAAETASGGKAVAAEFDENRGSGYYEVDTIANGKQVSVEIDASTGKVIKTTDEGDVAKADDDDIVDPAQLGAPLAELVAKAEQSGGGKVMSISAEHESGQAGMIEVELANPDGTTQEFAMAADGKMTPQVDDDGEDDEDGQDAG